MQDLMESAGLKLPRILLPLITRPLFHQPTNNRGNGHVLVEGFLLMEFNGQIFRRDISLPLEECRCTKCGRGGDPLNDRYTAEIARKLKLIARDVRVAARRALEDALKEMDE